ncbi:MAG: BrnT family toxin [Pyrinomonadaceae bacterium]
MNFEWDEEKNRENIRKHDLDFADASEIFHAPMLTNLDARKDYEEDRWVGIGFLKNFVVVVVYIESDDVIRIISLRKALKYERTRFEEAVRNELGEG